MTSTTREKISKGQTLSGKEILEIIGNHGYIRTPSCLNVEVKILDVKQSYGNTRYNVTPVTGFGSAWVQSLILKEDEYANS